MEEENIQNLDNQNPEKSGGFFRKTIAFVLEIVKIIVIASVIVLPIRYFLFQPFIVKGESMMPNFQTGNYLIVDEISYRFKNPERGDVIVFKYPKDKSQRFIKRVIGLPGETVEIKNGKINILDNNKNLIQLDEAQYLPESRITRGSAKTTLKNGEYFVLGDNREYSYDSRGWGILPEKDIVGRAFLRLFPVNEISIIATPIY